MKGTGRLVASLVFVGVLVIATLVGFVSGQLKPLLGLDLVGGVSVALQGPSNTSKDVMAKALEKIRERVDALGVAEPDITLLGQNTIQVQLPGLGGQGTVKRQGNLWCAYSSSGKAVGCYDTTKVGDAKAKAAAEVRAKGQSIQRVLQIIGKTARLEERPVLEILPPVPATDTKNAYNTTALTPVSDPKKELVTYEDVNKNGKFDPGVDPKYKLGPVVITGADLVKASATYLSSGNGQQVANPGWRVNFTLNGDGTKAFATATTDLVSKTPPMNQLAILVDKVVISAPTVQSPITTGTGEITGGFTQAEAKDLAVVLQSGALPVELSKANVETVSPTLGKQSLKQGLVAGFIGLVALMLYLAFYYRLLGIVTWVGMGIWAILAIGLVSLLGRTAGYALTLAGIAGLVVSLGITVDSYIVFYERLKDEVRHGKTPRAAVQPGFKRSFRTIIAADIVTAIAAGVLYAVSIGSVRGFALTLGLSTLLDVFVVWFYKRPTVFLLARSQRLTDLRGFGLRSGMAADPAPPTPERRPMAGVAR